MIPSLSARELPSGTVTFLFTDVEGSTRLLQEHGPAYADLLAGHRRVLREAFAQHSNWSRSEKDLRELRKKVTFAIVARENELSTVTEIVDGLKEGEVVVVGVNTPTVAANANTPRPGASPFGGSPFGGGFRPR